MRALRYLTITAFALSMIWPWAIGNPKPLDLDELQWVEVATATIGYITWLIGAVEDDDGWKLWGLRTLAFTAWLALWTAAMQFILGPSSVRGDILALMGVIFLGVGAGTYYLVEIARLERRRGH